MVVLAGVCWSMHGLTIRMIEVARLEKIVFWRSVSQFLVLFVLLALFNRGRVFHAIRAAGFVSVVASSSFVFAVSHTTVANVVFVMAVAPLFATRLAWLFMRETVPMRTRMAMLVA